MRTNIIIRILCTWFLLGWGTIQLAAQTHQWQRTNPGGGGAFSTVGASASGIIVAASDLSGAYISTDGGAHWQVAGAAQGLTETHISAVGFHRTNGQLLFVGTEAGIFRSSNGGQHWQRVLDGGYITAIEFATDQPDIGYAAWHPEYDALEPQIWRTDDAGLSWQPVSLDLPEDLRILKLAVRPDDANTLYALSGMGRFNCGPAELYRSTDGGAHWTLLAGDLPEVLDFAIDPFEPDRLWLTTMNADCDYIWYWTDLEGDLYVSTDGGDSWTWRSDYTGVLWPDASEAPDNGNTTVLRLIDPREPWPWNPRAGTFTSYDGGWTFVQTGFIDDWDTFYNGDPYWCYSSSFNGICKTLGTDLSDPHAIYWATSQWIFGSTDGGATFHNLFTDELAPGFWRSRGLDNVNMMDVAISAADPQRIWLAFFDMGIWRSIDGGLSWQNCNDPVFSGSWEGHGGNCATILADPVRPDVVWASQSEYQDGSYPVRLLKSQQGGLAQSWVAADMGLPHEQIMGLSVDAHSPTYQRTLFVTAQRDVYRSTNDGLSWSLVFDCDGCRFTAVDAANGQKVYAAGEQGVFRSLNGGLTWQSVGLPEMVAAPGADFWDYDYEGVFDLKADPVVPDRLYVVVFGSGGGLYRSDDGGQSWSKLLTDDYLRKVAVVPDHPDLLYATSSSAFDAGGYDPASNGVWFSLDGGQSWSRQNDGMAWPFALAVAVSRGPQPYVMVGAPGTGFQKADVPLPTAVGTGPASEGAPLRTRMGPRGSVWWLWAPARQAEGPVQVWDLAGRNCSARVRVQQESDGWLRLDLSDLPKGVYLAGWPGRVARLCRL